jgi:hypothetical protein
MTIEQLRELLTALGSDPGAVTDEQLSAAREFIRAHPTADVPTAQLRELRDARNTITDAQSTRTADAADREGLVSELGTDPAPAVEPAPPAAVPVLGEPAPETPPGEPAQPVAQPAAVPVGEPQAVAASGRTADVGTFRAAQATPRPTGEAVVVRTTAAGGVPTYEHGQVLESTADLALAFENRRRSLTTASRGGADEKVYVARTTADYPEGRCLSSDPGAFADNFGKIERVVSPRAMAEAGRNLRAADPDVLVAAGGLCAPLTPLYDIEVYGSTARPVRDALARFQVPRGGIQYRPNTSAAAALLASGVWTMANDEAVGVVETPTDITDPIKGCWVVECPGIQEAVVEAVYTCLEFSNITARFDPESTTANIQSAAIAHARLAENRLLAALSAGSKLLTSAKVIGATRDILVNLDKAVAYYRNRHRLDQALPLTFILPAWVNHLMRADLARQMAAGDWMEALGIAQSRIDGWFTRRAVNIVWHLDGSTADTAVGAETIPSQTYPNAAAGSAIPGFINEIDALLFMTGSWLYLDGGILDLGIVRDSVLNSRNRYRMFNEEFVGVADRGLESLRLNMTVQPTGETVGTTSGSAIND